MKHFMFVLVMLSSCLSATGQQYREVAIPTRVADTTKKLLLADLYANDLTTPKPVILIQTPYNKALYRQKIGNTSGGTSGASVPYDSSAYNYVTVDWRGFYTNTSAMIANYNRGLDGYDIVEWIAQQPWCNGKVGMWGGSALGQIQFLTAVQQPPHLVCAAPFIKDYTTSYEDYYYGGVYRQEHTQSLATLGFTNEQFILSRPTNDIIWKAAERQSDIADKITIPLFMCSGWFDHFPSDILTDFTSLTQKSDAPVRSKHKLLFGPWLHQGTGLSEQGILDFPNAAGIPVQMGLDFFNFYLRGIQNGWESLPAVRYYLMGDNQWQTASSWSAIPSANAQLFFREGNRLDVNPPPINVAPEPPDTLRANPRSPVPTIGGSRFNPTQRNLPLGPQDVQSLLLRSDVLSYSTEVLTKDVSLIGTSQATIFFRCNRTDADISVRLCDVYPDGRWVILTQGIQRLRFRRSTSSEQLLTPAKLDSAILTLNDLAITFKQGHKIGVILSGTNYPMFACNLNNGGVMYTAGDTLEAETQIFRTPEFSSVFTFRTTSPLSSVTESDNHTHTPLLHDNIALSPNPATSHITIDCSRISTARITALHFCSVLGKVYQLPWLDNGNGFYDVEIATLPPGVYILNVVTNHGTMSKKCSIIR